MMPKQQLSDCKAPQAKDDRHEACDLGWGSVAICYADVDYRDATRVVDAWNRQKCDICGQENSTLEDQD